MIRKLLIRVLAATGLSVLTLPVSAADLLASAAAMRNVAPVVPVFAWSGVYIGGNLGSGWSHRDFTNTLTGSLGGPQQSASNRGRDTGHGWLGGGQIGVNYQFSANWVAGIEADMNAAHIASSAFACFTGFGTGVCGTRDTELKQFGTLRGRLGYALGKVLVYGTGGWAWARGTNTTQFTCLGPQCPGTSVVPPTSPLPASLDVNARGWAAGGGVEWAFLPNWTLRAEYLHLQFDGITENRSKMSSFAPGLLVTTHVSSKLGVDLVRAGVSYMFSWR